MKFRLGEGGPARSGPRSWLQKSVLPKMDTTQSGCMDKQIMAYTSNRILFNHKNIDLWMELFWEKEIHRRDTEDRILNDSIYVKYLD